MIYMNSHMMASGLLREHFAREFQPIHDAEELRLSIGRQPYVITGDSEYRLHGIFTSDDMLFALERATGASIRTAASRITQGYINYNGLRVGVCGTGTYERDKLTGLNEFTSLDIRLSHECIGICDDIKCRIYGKNLLIISQPGGGKTTALREIVRILSEQGTRVGLVDERGEIAAMTNGTAQFDVGIRTDVLTGIEKSRAALMLLRGMSPQIIAMDEITKAEDTSAVLDIIGCGVGIIATAHAKSTDDLKKRAVYRELLEQRVFDSLLIISGQGKERRYLLENIA